MRRSAHRVLESAHVLEVFELCLVRDVKTSPEFERRMETPPSHSAAAVKMWRGRKKQRPAALHSRDAAQLSELLLGWTVFLDPCPPSSDFEDG